ncbi:ATP-dependent helicase [Candidatus Gottesmanbacteria bacterium]|nr:ATP-dependent helicase [Candidatus Gottesmanbacteria bacterium]
MKLNTEQREAIQHEAGPLLIIAGAGTGKTTVITERIKWLITNNLAKPSELLALTFTQKAAREMEERVDVLMPYGYTQMWVSTFHAFCDRVLRQEAIHIGFSPTYRLLSDTDATLLIRRNLFQFRLKYFRPLGNPTKFIQGMIHHFARLQDEDVTPPQYLEYVHKMKHGEDKLEVEKTRELAHAYKQYQELKVKEGLMDYGDLITDTLYLFRERKNILKLYQEKFKFVLVDEFQDTNVSQNELLLLLAGKHANLTAVADDDQSIYKFRGAAVSNVLSFRKNFPKAKLIVLTGNYRSTQEILDKAYRLILHNNPDRLEVKEGITKKLLSIRKEKGDPIRFLYHDRVENEAESVVKEIENLVGNGKNEKGENLYAYRDFAILLRANNYAEPFIRAFLRHGVPFQFLGPGQLFRQPEVKDFISYLHVLDNFEDNIALYRVLSMQYFDISARDLAAIANVGRKYNFSLFESCEIVLRKRNVPNIRFPTISEDSYQKLEKIIDMVIRHLKLIPHESAGQILYYFLEDTGMLKNILEYRFPLDEKQSNNISKFFSKLKSYEVDHQDTSVNAILNWITLSLELGESPQATDTDWFFNDAVNILTVHSAKGLEFKVVFMVNLTSSRFPSIEKKEQLPIPLKLIKEELPQGDYHEQEERRLFYVGMTRSCDKLYFTSSNYYGEGKREAKVSPFVYEALGDDVVASKKEVKTSDQLSLLAWQKHEKEEKKSKTNIQPISYISYSQIDSFRVCPLHYKLHYILNIRPPVSPALSFGSSIHTTLKDFYQMVKQGEKVSKKILLQLLTKNWIREGYTSKKYEVEMIRRGKNYLENYFTKEFDPNVDILVVEQPFTTTITLDSRVVKIGGRIDRIDDLGEGKIEIIDYKTGRIPTQREVDTNLQLSMYALAATEIREPPFQRKVEDIVLTLYYFDSQEKISTTRSTEQLNLEKRNLWKWIHAIETSDFRCSGNMLCVSCEYKMFCGIYNME